MTPIQPALTADKWAQLQPILDRGIRGVSLDGIFAIRPDQAAAALLYGRISWDWVAHLREEAAWRTIEAIKDPDYGEAHRERADVLISIADLLESLLAPRVPSAAQLLQP